LGLDLRSGDAGLTLEAENIGYGQAAAPTRFQYGNLTLAGRIVIDRRYDLAASASIIEANYAGTASLGWYPTKDLGLSIAGEVGHAAFFRNGAYYDRGLCGATVSWWVAPRVELWASSSLVWVDWGPGILWPEVTLGITGRIPGR
jgi:hypothetical protein